MLGIKVRLCKLNLIAQATKAITDKRGITLVKCPICRYQSNHPLQETPEPFTGNLEKSIERLPHTIEPLQEKLTIPVWRDPRFPNSSTRDDGHRFQDYVLLAAIFQRFSGLRRYGSRLCQLVVKPIGIRSRRYNDRLIKHEKFIDVVSIAADAPATTTFGSHHSAQNLSFSIP